MYFRRRSEFSGVSRSILDALSWTEEMGNRVVPAFLLIALLVPLPKAISAPFQAASSPFVDVPAAGTVQAAVGARRFALFRGLGAFSPDRKGTRLNSRPGHLSH